MIQLRKQQPSFIGLVQGACQPTDIDSYRIINNLLILVEIKKRPNVMDTGQRLILRRMADKWEESGGRSIVLVMGHRVEYHNSITPSKLLLMEYRLNGKWKKPKLGNLTLDMVMDKINKVNGG